MVELNLKKLIKKYIYNGLNCFEGGFAQNFILGVDDTSSKHSENGIDKFLVFGYKTYLYVT